MSSSRRPHGTRPVPPSTPAAGPEPEPDGQASGPNAAHRSLGRVAARYTALAQPAQETNPAAPPPPRKRAKATRANVTNHVDPGPGHEDSDHEDLVDDGDDHSSTGNEPLSFRCFAAERQIATRTIPGPVRDSTRPDETTRVPDDIVLTIFNWGTPSVFNNWLPSPALPFAALHVAAVARRSHPSLIPRLRLRARS